MAAEEIQALKGESSMADETTESAVSAHYGAWSLADTIEKTLRAEGVDPEQVTIEQLAPLDNFHAFGTVGTLELGRRAQIASDDSVLDVGGGVGGPARMLASQYGCHVTVLDLTPEFCEAGETLTRWTKLSDRVSFVCASALEMPFEDASFDVVWTQHAVMNIADKPRLYQEIHRVLRPGGRFALFDTLAGPIQPLVFPVPWANTPDYSFLLSPDETRALITSAGFVERDWLEGRELAAILENAASATTGPDGRPRGAPAFLMGPEGQLKIENATLNTKEGRIILGMGIFERV